MFSASNFSRTKWKAVELVKNSAQVRSDLYFLSKCKKLSIIPNGLVVKNPLSNTSPSKSSDHLCYKLSVKLRNHLISTLYSKQNRLENSISKLLNNLNAQEKVELTRLTSEIYYKKLHSLLEVKNKKLLDLKRKHNIIPPTTQSNNRTTTYNNHKAVNLSKYQPSQAEISVLSKGLNFCPTNKLDQIQLCGDLETFFRRLRLKEFFHTDAPSQNCGNDCAQYSGNNCTPNNYQKNTTTGYHLKGAIQI